MEHLSQQRLDWIDGRLFTLARMTHELRLNGMRLATGHGMTMTSNDASALVMEALKTVNVERLSLMVERSVINDYNRQQG